MKRIIALLSLFFGLSTHSLIGMAEPLHFKAVKGDKELMVFGSIHMGTASMYPLPEAVTQFLTTSDALITEIKLSDPMPTIPSVVQPTSNVLNNTQRAKLADISQRLGFPTDTFLSLPAWQTALALQLSQFKQHALSQEFGVDSWLTAKAAEIGITNLGLESIEYQLSLFTKDAAIGALLLTDTLEHWEESSRTSRCFTKIWKAGNADVLEQLMAESMMDPKLAEPFIYKRNQNWAEQLANQSFISEGRYLVVVGALHLVGKNNLLQLLADKGFEVTQLSKAQEVGCEW